METIKYCHPCGSDVWLDCELEFDAGEPGNPDIESGTCCPPTPAAAFLISASICGKDISFLLSDHLRTYIEERAVCFMQH